MRQTTYGIGGYDPTKPNNNVVEEIEVDDPAEPVEQAADRGRVLTKAEQTDLADAVAANEAWVKSRKGTVDDQVAALTTQVNELMRTQLPDGVITVEKEEKL